MVVTRSAAQALLLEGFMHRYMRHFELEAVVSSSVSNSIELYRPEARDVDGELTSLPRRTIRRRPSSSTSEAFSPAPVLKGHLGRDSKHLQPQSCRIRATLNHDA